MKFKKLTHLHLILCLDETALTVSPLGKNARKSKEMAGIFSSMQINSGDSTQHYSKQLDEFLPDFEETNNTNDDIFKFVKNEKTDCFLEDQDQTEFDCESLTSKVGCKNEKEILWAQRSEYSKEIARMVGPDHPSIPTSYNSMEKSRKKYGGGPVDPNGRYKGRKLVLWHSKFSDVNLVELRN